MHQNHCQRNIKLCEHCQEPVPISDMEEHFEEEHKKIPCECGESIEKCKVEDHKAKHCPQRSVKCEYCEIDLPFAKIAEHKDFCGSRTEHCPKCMRYIQIKDQDMHDISECQLPEVQSQPKSKPSNNMAEDNFDGLEAALLRSTGAEWPGNWESNFGFLSHQSHTEHKSTSDFYDLTSPVWYNHTEQVPHLNLKKKTENQPDRRLRKNQDRVQNTLGSTGRKKTQGSSSQGTGVSRPWEKNDTTQQNLSQEESDHLLAMHLAKDLQGGELNLPGQHTFKPPTYTNHDIDQILKEAYEVPAANTYQEPNFTQSSIIDITGTDESSMLPCEFCQQLFSADNLILHESGCGPPDMTSRKLTNHSTNNNRQRSSSIGQSSVTAPNVHDMSSVSWLPSMPALDNGTMDRKSSSVDTEDDCIMLPCEFCGDLLPAEFLSHHQVNCTENTAPTPTPPSLNTMTKNRISPNLGLSMRPRPRMIPAPTSLDLNPRSVKHQGDPNFDVPMASPDSKPTKDDTNPISRSTGLPKARKSKVTSTVTRPGPGHLISSPVDKYLNGRPYDRDINNGGMVAKSRVVTVERKVRNERPHSKSSSRVQRTLHDLTDAPEMTALSCNDFDDDEVTPLYTTQIAGKSTKNQPTSPNVHHLNNKQKPETHTRTKPVRKAGNEGAVYQPSFGVSNERRRGSDKNVHRGSTGSSKPSTRTKHSTASVVNLEAEDDLVPVRLNKSSKQSTGGAKPKQKKHHRKPDDDTM